MLAEYYIPLRKLKKVSEHTRIDLTVRWHGLDFLLRFHFESAICSCELGWMLVLKLKLKVSSVVSVYEESVAARPRSRGTLPLGTSAATPPIMKN
jgi:hypothetical protein